MVHHNYLSAIQGFWKNKMSFLTNTKTPKKAKKEQVIWEVRIKYIQGINSIMPITSAWGLRRKKMPVRNFSKAQTLTVSIFIRHIFFWKIWELSISWR